MWLSPLIQTASLRERFGDYVNHYIIALCIILTNDFAKHYLYNREILFYNFYVFWLLFQNLFVVLSAISISL